jgi:hypothetical protein
VLPVEAGEPLGQQVLVRVAEHERLGVGGAVIRHVDEDLHDQIHRSHHDDHLRRDPC